MYSRPLKENPETIIHDGKINFGSFKGVPKKLDIRGVKAPFAGIPTSRLFSNFRIKSKIIYAFCYEKYAGLVEFFDDKVFGLAEVILWNRETKQKFAYHTFMGPRKRFVPIDTNEASCTSFSKKRYIKISWNRNKNKLKLSFTLKGDRFRPAMKGKFYSDFNEDKSAEVLFVNPAPTMQRCSATWLIPLNLIGGIGSAKHRKQITYVPEIKGSGLMYLNRTYLKEHSYSEILFGFYEQDKKKICFTFSNSSYNSLDDDCYNDNMLSVDGENTALPPVKITHPFGIYKNWIIQDTESMVDLSFTPVSYTKRTVNIIVMRNADSTMYGTFEGTLLTKNQEKIVLKNCPGLIKKSVVRL